MASYITFLNHFEEYKDLNVSREEMFELAREKYSEDRIQLLLSEATECFSNPPKHDRCIELCNVLIQECKIPNPLKMAYWFAALLYDVDKKDYVKALDYYMKALEIEPDFANCMLSISGIYRKEKKWAEAIEWAMKAQQDEDYSMEAIELMGDIHLESKNYNEAIERYEQYLDLDEPTTAILCNLGIAHFYKQDFTKAKELFHEAMELDPEYADVRYYIGQCWQEEGDFYRAMNFYTQALELHPYMPEVHNNIAKLYYDHEGDYKGAIGYLEKAVEEATEPLAKNMMILYQNLGKLYKQMLNTEKSDYYFRKWYECQGLEMLFDYTHDGTFNLDDDDENENIDEEEDDV